MAKKDFTYRGLTIDTIKTMSVSEFAKLIPSRERRTLLRGFTDDEKSLLRKLAKKDKVKTHCREMVAVPQMLGKTIMVHNGKEYHAVMINEEMLGHRLGEFTLTRKPIKHSSPGVSAASKGKDKVSVD